MPTPQLIQLHFLHTHTGVLLNRGEQSEAKRLLVGGVMRTRQSSQSVKHRWRKAQGEHALESIADMGVRSREIVTELIMKPIRGTGPASEEVMDAVERGFQTGIYGSQGSEKAHRQMQLFGFPDVEDFRNHAQRICQEATTAEEAAKITAQFFKDYRANNEIKREQSYIPGSLTAALFGKMVTADYGSSITGAVSVAHPFTVHGEQSESDFLTAVDDLEPTAGHIGQTEVNSGVFYTYAVVSVPQLVSNIRGSHPTEWLSEDREIAARTVEALIDTAARYSYGAKLGSTAAMSYASFIMAEMGTRQPRNLAEAFHTPVEPDTVSAMKALERHMKSLDRNYGPHEARRYMSTYDYELESTEQLTMDQLSKWVGQSIVDGKGE